MDTELLELTKRLVQKYHGVQRQAAHAAELSPSLISNIMHGKGPKDPRGLTKNKVRRALGMAQISQIVGQGVTHESFASLIGHALDAVILQPEDKTRMVNSIIRLINLAPTDADLAVLETMIAGMEGQRRDPKPN